MTKIFKAPVCSAMLLAALAAPAGAATPATVTLEDVIAGAQRSDNITIQQQDEKVRGAAARLKQASGAFDWNVNAQTGRQALYGSRAVGGVLTSQTDVANSYFYSGSIGRKFRNGIEVAPGITGFPGAGLTAAQTSGLTQLRPSLGLKIPLGRGLGEESADAGERAAADALSSTRLYRNYAVAQVLQNAVVTFWKCVANDQLAQISQTAEHNAASYESTLKDMVRRGLLEPTVAQQWTANNTARHLDLLKAQDASQLCRRDLGYAITGLPNAPTPAPSGALPDVEALTPAISRLNVDALTRMALDNRNDLQGARQQVDSASENQVAADDAKHPEIDLHIEPDRAIVSYTQSIQNNTAEGLSAAAVSAKSLAQLTQRQLEDQIRMDVSDTVHNLQRASVDWKNWDTARSQMETVVADARKRAQFGAINWSDFLAAQDQLVQLQQQALNAQLLVAEGLCTLRLATGTVALDGETPAMTAAKFTALPETVAGVVR